MEYKYLSIILGKIDIAETDRIYTVYSLESGKIRLVAKGVRKPNAKLAGNLETISLSEIFVAKGKGSGKITGVISVNGFLSIKENIFPLERVFYIFRIFNNLVSEEEKDERLFDLLLGFLEALEKLSASFENELKIELITQGFIFKLLDFLGYGFQVEKCAFCACELFAGKNYFSVEKGGILCANCSSLDSKKRKISDESIKLIRIFSKNKIRNFEKISVEKKDILDLKIISEEALRWVIN